MKGFERFQKAMSEAAQQNLKPMMEDCPDTLAEIVKNKLFDLEGPRQVDLQSGGRKLFFSKVFHGFGEISKSLETLIDIEFYISRFPFQRTRVTRERYLQFHVESYFSEIYLLRERLKRYITLLERQYKRSLGISNVQERCKALTDAITSSLAGVTDIRGRHVHEARFSDDDIDRLSLITLLLHAWDNESASLMTKYYRYEYRRVKKNWFDKIKANNKTLRELLDFFFDSLFPIVFDENTSLRYPRGART